MDVADPLVSDLSSKVFGAAAVATRDGELLDRSLWTTFASTGLAELMAAGGESSLLSAVAVLCDAGRSAARIPAAESMLAYYLAERASWSESSALATVVCSDDAWRAVPWGRYATSIYFVRDQRIARQVSPITVVRLGTNLSGEPRDEIRIESQRVELSDAAIEPQHLESLAALCRAALMVGAMQATMDLTLEHARNRVQFGKPIAKFQAVQQMLARLAGHIAAASAAVDLAAASFSGMTAAIAKSRASESVSLVTDIVHQVTGAMGFTEEFALHRFTKRLWAWRDENGSEGYWNRHIGARVSERAQSGLWPLLSQNSLL